MALKTLLVHLAGDKDHAARLALAGQLAKQHGAHLVGLFISRPLDLAPEIAGRAASLAFVEAQAVKRLETAKRLSQDFSDFCHREQLTHDWIVEDRDHLEALARHAHAADMVIVSRGPEKTLEDRARLHLAEELVIVSGLPVFVLPEGYQAAPLGQKILVAWKPTREAVRAIGDALPLLTQAQEVKLATVAEEAHDALSHQAVRQHLLRHGVPVESLPLSKEEGVATALLKAARQQASDLIVLGAYSHARWREVLFGGVTRALFRQSRLPLLMSH